MTAAKSAGERWHNWAGNQHCAPTIVTPTSTSDLQDAVADAARRGGTVRVVGSGHSFTPLVCTDDVMVDVGRLSGLIGADLDAATAVVGAGTTLHDLLPQLWAAGLSLRNQGDIDAQTVGGAIGTATHGSGRAFGSFSSVVRSITYVGADAGVHSIDAADPRFDAFRTSLGLLGIFTAVELDLQPAYYLRERIEHWPLAEVMRRWQVETSTRRHFSYFWPPAEHSLEMYGFAPTAVEDGCHVKIYDELAPPQGAVADASEDARVAPAYQIYASDFDLEFHEFEYFIPFDHTPAAVDAVRAVMLDHPEQAFPLEVRTIAAEDAWLSPMYGRDSTSLSVSGVPGTDYGPFTRAFDAALRPFDARPHWGKLHLFDRARLRAGHPRFDDFCAVRADLDPDGLFLNEHTAQLFTEPTQAAVHATGGTG
ncbi:MAG TPA: D-arabinono-1,4-lactone oxidase [Mycobacterium sp.]|nr:D-arabinono-1,4-lactone oxidase [Mycobacterium sp.]